MSDAKTEKLFHKALKANARESIPDKAKRLAKERYEEGFREGTKVGKRSGSTIHVPREAMVNKDWRRGYRDGIGSIPNALGSSLPLDLSDENYFTQLVKYHLSLAYRHRKPGDDTAHNNAEDAHEKAVRLLRKYWSDNSESNRKSALSASNAARSASKFTSHLPGFEDFYPPVVKSKK